MEVVGRFSLLENDSFPVKGGEETVQMINGYSMHHKKWRLEKRPFFCGSCGGNMGIMIWCKGVNECILERNCWLGNRGRRAKQD